MESQLIEAWQMSNEANFYLLENIAEDYLQDSYTTPHPFCCRTVCPHSQCSSSLAQPCSSKVSS